MKAGKAAKEADALDPANVAEQADVLAPADDAPENAEQAHLVDLPDKPLSLSKMWPWGKPSNCFAERCAAREKKKAQIADALREAEDEASRLAVKARKKQRKAAAELEARERAEEREARIKFATLVDDTLRPLAAPLHEETSNALIKQLIDKIRSLNAQRAQALGDGASEGFVMRRLSQLVVSVHVQERPGIASSILDEEFWTRSDYLTRVPSIEFDMRKAIEKGDVSATRAAFEKLDGVIWSATERDNDPESVALWALRSAADPTAYETHLAQLEEEKATAAEKWAEEEQIEQNKRRFALEERGRHHAAGIRATARAMGR